jgi:hypothetical protein
MKHTLFAAVLSAAILLTGCTGSLSLSSKLYSWNQDATGNKFINSGILWILSGAQVYSATLLIDVAILNVIEFWTGKNPLAFTSPQELEKIVTSNGHTYKVCMGNSVLSINELDTDHGITIQYDAATSSYFLDDQQDVQVKLGTIETDNLHLFMPDGKIVTRTLKETNHASASAL